MINRIMSLMKQNNINAKELEVNSGLPNGSINAWKNSRGKPSADALIKLSNYLNVSTDYLLKGIESDHTLDNLDLELLHLFRSLDAKQKEMFLGKVELIINDMLDVDSKKHTGT